MDQLLGRVMERDIVIDGYPNPRGEALARLSIICGSLAAVSVIARLVTRYSNGKMFGADDALIVAAMVLAICLVVTYNEEASHGFGLHKNEVSYANKVIAFKWFFAAQILYKVTTCLTKLSLGTLYLRIFRDKKFRIAVTVVMAICVAYTIAAVLLTVFACNPIYKSWNKQAPGKCLDMRNIWYSTSILNIVTDAMIIALPLNEIRHLQLRLVKKVLLGALFSLGCFVIACTIVRMTTVSPQTTASDQTYYQATSNSWTFIETDVGIICACLPIVRVPISNQFRRLLGLTQSGSTLGTGPSRKGSNIYPLQTVGHDSSRHPMSRPDHQGDSVEELIHDNYNYNNNKGKVAMTFTTDVTGDYVKTHGRGGSRGAFGPTG